MGVAFNELATVFLAPAVNQLSHAYGRHVLCGNKVH